MRAEVAPRRGGRADRGHLSLAVRRAGSCPRPLVCVGIGGNIGGREELTARFAAAARLLAMVSEPGSRLECSRVYQTEAIGPVAGQDDYFNAAVALHPAIDMSPRDFLAELWRIERWLGRRRPTRPRRGPRRIDLDILLWGDQVIETPTLQIPHSRLGERAFALMPLCDLLGADHAIPSVGVIEAALAAVRSQRCEPVSDLRGCCPGRVRLD